VKKKKLKLVEFAKKQTLMYIYYLNAGRFK